MIKKISLCVAVGLALVTFSQVQAASLTNSGPGETISFDPAVPTSAPNFVFTPSPAVSTNGTSGATGFVFSAVHSSALNKTDGKQYAMASDSNQIWWLDVSTLTAITDVSGGSNSAILSTKTFTVQ